MRHNPDSINVQMEELLQVSKALCEEGEKNGSYCRTNISYKAVVLCKILVLLRDMLLLTNVRSVVLCTCFIDRPQLDMVDHVPVHSLY